jgi:hypothetical protein
VYPAGAVNDEFVLADKVTIFKKLFIFDNFIAALWIPLSWALSPC